MSAATPHVGDGDHHIPTDSLSDLLPPATDLPDNLACDASNEGVAFGDFFFDMLNAAPLDAAGDSTPAAGADAGMDFGDFCLDGLCGADAWPVAAESTGAASVLPQDPSGEAGIDMESAGDARGGVGIPAALDTPAVAAVAVEIAERKDPTPSHPSGRAAAGNDCSVQSSSGSGCAPRVPKEGVEVWLRRAEQLIRGEEGRDNAGLAVNAEATTSQVPFSASSLTGGEGLDDKGSSKGDEAFNAQVAHWLRRGAEVQESALATVANMQLRLTQLLRLFGAHSGLAALLGQQYATTPAVLTLPLILPMLESLLEEE